MDLLITDLIDLTTRSAFAGTTMVPARDVRNLLLDALDVEDPGVYHSLLRETLRSLVHRSLVAPDEIHQLCLQLAAAEVREPAPASP